MNASAECARTEPAECVECKELGCPTEGMTFMCKDPGCYEVVCFGHATRHQAKHEAEHESESCCGEGCVNCGNNDEDLCGR